MSEEFGYIALAVTIGVMFIISFMIRRSNCCNEYDMIEEYDKCKGIGDPDERYDCLRRHMTEQDTDRIMYGQ